MIRELFVITFALGLAFAQYNTVNGVRPVGIMCITGECVPHYQCNNNEFVTDGNMIINIRASKPSPRVCKSTETCCGQLDEMTTSSIVDKPILQGCGLSPLYNFTRRLESDQQADYAEFPWMAVIFHVPHLNNHQPYVYHCGGSLIHPSVILTAAHCVIRKAADLLKVRLGEWNRQNENEPYPHQDRSVVDFIIHPEFEMTSLSNDVALLFLNETVELGEHIQTVCLPPQGSIFDGSRCITSGWGKNQFGSNERYQVILKKLELPIIPTKACQAQLRSSQLGSQYSLHQSFMCAGGELGSDACDGDGGSPLVCPIPGTNKRYYQSGIVAWGFECGENPMPGVYVNIAQLKTWIDGIFITRNLDKSFYTYE